MVSLIIFYLFKGNKKKGKGRKRKKRKGKEGKGGKMRGKEGEEERKR